jgi:glyoxylase-like metal-dependent hydrolase (beta-lactamase superfamily II)
MLGLVFASVLAAAPLEPIALADGVTLLRGGFVPGRQPDGNTVVFRAPRGLVVVDTGRHAGHSDRILAWVREQDAPVAVVVNTHWHLDHVGGNPRLRAAYPQLEVHASDAIDDALEGFLANYRKQLVGLAAAAEPEARARFETEIALIDAGAALKPDRVVQSAGTKALAGRTFRIGLERAATKGDVWLYDPATRVLVAGDLVTLPAPFLDTACPRRWREALDRLDDVPFVSVVPGHGQVLDRAAFTTYRTAFGALLDCAASDSPGDACVTQWIDSVEPLLEDADPKFVHGLTTYYVTDVLRAPADRKPDPCAEH